MRFCIKSFCLLILLAALVSTLSFCQKNRTFAAKQKQADTLNLTVRYKTETAKDSGRFHTLTRQEQWKPQETAIVVCDMWDLHHCLNATKRGGEMAPRMNQVLKTARKQGVTIIHAPSSCMPFYKDHPARKHAQLVPKLINLPEDIGKWCYVIPEEEQGTYPIDQTDGGEDDDLAEHAAWAKKLASMGRNPRAPWKRQTKLLDIDDADYISDNGEEIWSIMELKGIDNVILLGVHTNMCVLGRPFGLRQMAKNGKNVVLMRDMTDTMYNPKMPPYVSHFTGTDFIIDHIEKYVCPTITSVDILGGQPAVFKNDKRPHLVIVMAEQEYFTNQTLPKFAVPHLGNDFKVSYVSANAEDRNDIPGLEVLDTADIALISVRRRVLHETQMKHIRNFAKSGKPIVGIRTASHAFSLRKAKPPEGYFDWPEFDNAILGGNYKGHHGKQLDGKPNAHVWTLPVAKQHPILTGIKVENLPVYTTLYQVLPLAESATPLMLGKIEGDAPHEPVAWTNRRKNGGKVFYTSLGHLDDFKLPEFRRLLMNGIYWAAGLPVPKNLPKVQQPEKTTATHLPGVLGILTAAVIGQAKKSEENKEIPPPLSPADSLKTISVFEGLAIDQVLTEPEVKQPLYMQFDERGRLWVLNYEQYPYPAGLKMLSRDKFWRAVYDKVPLPPPHGAKGHDRITIHEDTDGDGKFDKHKTFLDGLNIATSFAFGRGGVWVLNPPYLLFYPDKNKDDIPDGDPVVHLEGFGLEDTHSAVSSLRWGPDGWLYSSQGSTVSGNVRQPGGDKKKQPGVYSMGQLIWRYHPETKRYEIFAEGGGNAHGVEIDSVGRIYSGHNGGNTRGFHYVQGGYFQKGFSKHGPLSNPYAFGYFPAMKHAAVPRFTHDFVIYEGGALPKPYDGRLFGVEPLQGQIVNSDIFPDGTTYKTVDQGRPVKCTDPRFRPVEISVGPDGGIYFCDMYEIQISHREHFAGNIEKSTGRIYRLRAKNAQPIQPFDLGKKSSVELVKTLQHPNKWFRQRTMQILADRQDRALAPLLEEIIDAHTDQFALEALWALNLSCGLNDRVALKTLDHPNPFVRQWTVRLLCDKATVTPTITDKLAELASSEPHPQVRSQLASSAQRLPAKTGLAIVRNLLAHVEDTNDIHIPLLLWWAIEKNADSDRDQVLELFENPTFWDLPTVKQHLVERVMRRYALAGSRKDLQTAAKLLSLSPSAEHTKLLMSGFETAYKGRSLSGLPDELVKALAASGGTSLVLKVRQGNAEGIEEALKLITDEKTDAQKRIDYIQLFGEVKHEAAVPILLKITETARDDRLVMAAITSLQPYPKDAIAAKIISLYPNLSDDVRSVAHTLLSSRETWAEQLLNAVDSGALPKSTVPVAVVRKMTVFRNDRISKLIKKHWGTIEGQTTEQMQAQIAKLKSIVSSAGEIDRKAGKELYKKTCGKCHVLFGEGGKIGPDLTPFKRNDVHNIVANIVNPSAEIREGFETYLALTEDGRTVTGFLVDRDTQVVIFRGADGQNITLKQSEIEEMIPQKKSLMPEGQLKDLTEQQVKDLFSYIRSSQPLNY